MVAAVITGCGTTHHFLPGAPLEKKEWQISVAWHYDFNNLRRWQPRIFPTFNAYVGAGKNYNLGFGAELPCWVNHASVARYWSQGQGDYLAAFAHINQVAGVNDNPTFELGGQFSCQGENLRQNVVVGLSYGHCLSMPLSFTKPQGKNLTGLVYRLIPVLKYNLVGQDLGVSYVRYHGHAATALEPLQHRVQHENDTIFLIGRGGLDSIAFLSEYRGNPADDNSIFGLFLASGDTLLFSTSPLHACGFAYGASDVDMGQWLGRGYKVYYGIGKLTRDKRVVLNVGEIKHKWTGNTNVVITEYPPYVLEKIRKTRSLIADNSFGFAIMGFSGAD